MPSIAHLVLGGVFGICLYYISNGKFSKTHVFVLFLNNYLGPDTGWVLGPIGPFTHTLVGWCLFAFILAIFYHYFTRFGLKLNGLKDIELIDHGKSKMPYLSVYCLVAAGGIMHNYLDGIMNNTGRFYFIPELSTGYSGLNMNIEEIINLWWDGVIDFNPILSLLIGISFILGFVFVFVWFIKKNSIFSALISVAYIIAFVVFYYLVGYNSTVHADGPAVLYVSIFWCIPIILCVLSTKSIRLIKRDGRVIKEDLIKKYPRNLIIISIWLLLLGGICSIAAILGLIFQDSLLSIIYEHFGEQISSFASYDQVILTVNLLLILILSISLFNLILGVGLLLKKRTLWKITIYYHLILSWTIIGLIIACAISENSVKNSFLECNFN